MECFRLLLEHLAWIDHQFLSGIRDSRKAGSLWGMIRGVGGVRKSIDQSWLAKGLVLVLLFWGFKGVQEEIPSEEANTIEIGSVAFLPRQYTSPQPHPCHRLFDQDGHQDSSSSSYSRDLAPCGFCLFPKFRSCRYETIEELKEAMTKVIDMLTQEDFHGALQKLLEQYNKCFVARGDYFEGDWSFKCVLSIKVPIRKKSGNLFNDPPMFLSIISCCLAFGSALSKSYKYARTLPITFSLYLKLFLSCNWWLSLRIKWQQVSSFPPFPQNFLLIVPDKIEKKNPRWLSSKRFW